MVKDTVFITNLINGLTYNKVYFASIIFRPYCEVNPIMTLGVSLDEELIKVPLGSISDIEKDVGIAKRLFHANATDIHGATR